MRWVSSSRWVGPVVALLCALTLASAVLAQGRKVQKYKRSDVDIPVSLAVGTVRTPEFAVADEAYFMMVQVEKKLPFREQQCMMALPPRRDVGPQDCNEEPLLQADWTVLDGERIVDEGTSSRYGHAMYTDEHMYKIMGPFMGESGKRYVVEMKFTSDGTPLNVCNPHLIVIRVRYH